MDKKVVGVTGAKGLIGEVVVKILKEKGYVVKDERVEVSDMRAVLKFAKDCDYLIHLAVEMDMSKDKEVFEKTNVVGVKNILNCKGPKIVMVSSVVALQYPKGNTGNYYVDTKVTGLNLTRKSKNKVVTVMPSVVIDSKTLLKKIVPSGSWWMNSVWNSLGGGIPGGIMSAIGDKNRIINMVEVNDVACGIVLAMEKGELGEEYILAGENIKVIDQLQKMSALLNKKYLKIRIPYWLVNLYNIYCGKKMIVEPVGMNFNSNKAIKELGYKINWHL